MLHVNEYGFHSIYNWSNMHLHSCYTTIPGHGTEDNYDIWNHFCFNINLPWIYADYSMFPIEASTFQRHPTILQFFSGYTKSNFHFYLIFHRISWYDVKNGSISYWWTWLIRDSIWFFHSSLKWNTFIEFFFIFQSSWTHLKYFQWGNWCLHRVLWLRNFHNVFPTADKSS